VPLDNCRDIRRPDTLRDEVVTTPLSFIASANAIVYEGGVPVFVDVDDTWVGYVAT